MAFRSVQSSAYGPVDDSPQWREIYDRLSASIGAPQAYSWFAHCRFVRLQSDTLELAHWTRFGARECTGKFGLELCRAAKVRNIRIYRTGGHVPHSITTPVTARNGYETFTFYGDNVPRDALSPEAA